MNSYFYYGEKFIEKKGKGNTLACANYEIAVFGDIAKSKINDGPSVSAACDRYLT